MNRPRYLVAAGAAIFAMLLLTGVLQQIIAWLMIPLLVSVVLWSMNSGNSPTRMANRPANGEYETISAALEAVAAMPGMDGAEVVDDGQRTRQPMSAAIRAQREAEQAGEIDREVRAYRLAGQTPMLKVVAIAGDDSAEHLVVRRIRSRGDARDAGGRR